MDQQIAAVDEREVREEEPGGRRDDQVYDHAAETPPDMPSTADGLVGPHPLDERFEPAWRLGGIDSRMGYQRPDEREHVRFVLGIERQPEQRRGAFVAPRGQTEVGVPSDGRFRGRKQRADVDLAFELFAPAVTLEDPERWVDGDGDRLQPWGYLGAPT